MPLLSLFKEKKKKEVKEGESPHFLPKEIPPSLKKRRNFFPPLIKMGKDRDRKKCCKSPVRDQCVSPVLPYQKIYDELWPDQTGAIYHQFEWQELGPLADFNFLEVEKEFTIPVNRTLSGTQPNPNSYVYGYNTDGSLDLTGGKAKSYNQPFEEFHLKYNGALEGLYHDPSGPVTQLLSTLTPDVIKGYYDYVISYFTARGFDIQGPDTFSKFNNTYNWTLSSGQFQQVAGGYVSLQLIWNNQCNKGTPSFVDLCATANTAEFQRFVLDTYQPNPLLKQNGHGYPLRIPITTSFSAFQTATTPIAFYDKQCLVLTIHVPENQDGYLLTKQVSNTGNPASSIDYEDYLKAFDCSFAVLKRDKNNALVSTKLKCAQVFAQNSENMYIKSHVVNFGPPIVPKDYILNNLIRSPVLAPETNIIYYTGAVCPLMNGGSPSFDVYAMPVPLFNAGARGLDPIQLPEETEGDSPHPQGDSPITSVVEQYSEVLSITYYDNKDFNKLHLNLSTNLLTGSFYPENAGISPVPSPATNVDAYKVTSAHEFTHQTQAVSGMEYFIPVEGMAVGIEMDTRISDQTIFTGRASNFAQRLVRLTRANFTIMRPDSQQTSTYGLGLFWKYLQDQFDFNNQAMRRTADILTNVTAGQLLKANNFPSEYVANVINNRGGSAALNQALIDLFGPTKNIRDVFNDFSISLVLLRNNTSIPAQWRHYWPYWIYNSKYVGYPSILGSLTFHGIPQFAPWWEMMDTNAVIPASWGNSATQTVIRTIPYINTPNPLIASVKDLMALSFNILPTVNTLTINVSLGTWRITLLQYTTDPLNPTVGFFMQDPALLGTSYTLVGPAAPLVFNIATHVPAFRAGGNIRLVCVNISSSGTGTALADYYSTELNSGTISIASA